MSDQRPLIALTMGDPAGIGPEIIVGAWTETVVHEWCRPLVIGNPENLRRAAALWQRGEKVVEIDSPASAEPSPEVVPCLVCGSSDVFDVVPGTLCAGQANWHINPWSSPRNWQSKGKSMPSPPHRCKKKLCIAPDHHDPGHTELLADLCGVDDFAMMLYLGPSEEVLSPHSLAVVTSFCTRHCETYSVCSRPRPFWPNLVWPIALCPG